MLGSYTNCETCGDQIPDGSWTPRCQRCWEKEQNANYHGLLKPASTVAPVDPNPVATACKVVFKALREEPGYRESWKANLAMAFYDETMTNPQLDLHTRSNRAADRFLDILTAQDGGE